VEAYKGLAVLIEAARRLPMDRTRLVIAGPGNLDRLMADGTPANVEVRNRHIGDEEAMDLFRRCGLLVLPYIEASQSALVAAAYCFSKPVVVTNTGALAEYVVQAPDPGQTGWVIPPGDPVTLARILDSSLEDPDRLARHGEAGRRWYERQRRSEEQAIRRLYATMAARSQAHRAASAATGRL
jgi:glycosyltransferase involved in cell wall biosynthesis